MKTLIYASLFALLSVGPLFADYGALKKAPETLANLDAKLKWAENHAKNVSGRYWVGYSFEQMMGENSTIGVHYHFNDEYEDGPTLREYLSGARGTHPDRESSLSEAAEKALRQKDRKKDRRRSERQTLKQIAILIEYADAKMRPRDIRELRISNLELYLDLQEKPLLWMGNIAAERSIDYLAGIYEKLEDDERREDMVTAIALHKGREKTFRFLTDLVENEKSTDIREHAVFWLGQQDDERALAYLVKVVENDRSMDVREKAIFSMSQLDMEAATDMLIKIARDKNAPELRQKAVFWLSQRASKKAVTALKEIVFDAEESELQSRAVFALSQMSGEDTVPFLIDIARTHQNYEVRKKAIFWLSQMEDDRALDAIIEIVRE